MREFAILCVVGLLLISLLLLVRNNVEGIGRPGSQLIGGQRRSEHCNHDGEEVALR